MKRDELKALELTDDQIDKIMAINGRDIEKHKTAAETAKTEAETLQKQLTEAAATIEGFKKLDVDGIKKAADDYKAQAEKATADAVAQVTALKFDHALAAELTGAKAKNPATVKALLKLDDLKLAEDGKVIGLDDQLKAIRESNDFLFESDAPPPPAIVAGGTLPSTPGDPVWDNMLKGAGLKDPQS